MSEEKFQRLVDIMETLRSERGCPWDKEQTRQSLKSFLIEEAYELLEAIDNDEPERIKEELGDLLFQILFHAQIAKERDEFDIYDVIDKITTKMLSRHPHVFGEMDLNSSEEVLQHWDEHKKREGKLKESLMEGIPDALPALLRAMRVQERASRVGFDWERTEDVFEKVEEEMEEFKKTVREGSREDAEEELGDLLFSLVNLSRFINVNPEEALRRTVSKFVRRFKYIENRAKEEGKDLSSLTLQQMDILWEEAKRIE
jgi:tetrapyrrole methylase family protein/MazG family protein